jgi:DNA repair protein RadA/Sms
MAKNSASFTCQNCGAVYNRWQGKCESCGEWNSIAEEGAAAAGPGRAGRKGRVFTLQPLTGETQDAPPAYRNSIASPAAASCAARCC